MEMPCLQFHQREMRSPWEEVTNTGISNWEGSEIKGQIGESQIYSGALLAYASVIYVVKPQADGNTKVSLLVAKTRVAPVKHVSIPRLELNSVLLLARLYATCKNILKEYDVYFYAWTDSQVVLYWLSSHPRNWKPYIANRTSKILDLVPADIGFRGPKHFLHVFYGGKAFNGFPVRWTLGLSNLKEMIRLV
ncbi:uncharacterized protein TNCV_4453731 [Trichonephila clavipes]|nr:uncharacterized protein TNCV_4453731 [Trichonephila clavipes]